MQETGQQTQFWQFTTTKNLYLRLLLQSIIHIEDLDYTIIFSQFTGTKYIPLFFLDKQNLKEITSPFFTASEIPIVSSDVPCAAPTIMLLMEA